MRHLLVAALVAIAPPLHPAVVGTSKPAESLTVGRVIGTLPSAEQEPWLTYLRRSAAQLSFDQDELFIERSTLQPPYPRQPPPGNGTRAMPADREPAFYRTPEALHTALTILSFQVPNGGWSKNLDMSGPPRVRGQLWASDNISHYLTPSPDGQPDFDQPANPAWNYIATLDNDATTTELHFLARISSAYPGRDGDKFRKAFVRGVYYLLRAQFPNGGWPQVYPLEGGYHDAITFNDNAVTESAALLHDASTGIGDFAFLAPDLRTLAAAAASRAIACILKTQLVVAGKKTVWAQQHDALTLLPVAGRNYEPAALSAGESSDILLFLMKLPNPDPEVRASIEAGIAWLQSNALHDHAWVGGRRRSPTAAPTAVRDAAPASPPPTPRHLEPSPGAPPLWPRYTSLQTGKPIFGDRDKSIHSNVDELSLERRNGYAWYSPAPQAALDAYATWKSR